MNFSLRTLKAFIIKDEKVSFLYFVGRDRTRSATISVRKIALISLAMVVICLFSIFLTIANLITFGLGTDTDRLLQRQATIFDYQSRYDSVFESTYNAGERNLIVNNSLPSQQEPKPSPGVAVTQGSSTVSSHVESQPTSTVAPSAVPSGLSPQQIEVSQSTLSKASSMLHPKIGFSELKIKAAGDETILQVSLRNNSDKSLSGYAYAVAEIHKPNGATTFLSSPEPEMVFEKDGSVLDHTAGKRYIFKKQRNFEFKFFFQI